MSWLKEILCGYEIHSSNISKNTSLSKLSTLKMYDKFFEHHMAIEDFPAADFLYAKVHVICGAGKYNSGCIEDAKKEIEAAINRYPEFLSNNASLLFNLLVNWAGNPFVSNPITYLEIVFSNLPSSIDHLNRQKHKAFAQIYMKTFFYAHKKEDYSLVKKMFINAIRYDMTWIFNHGVISIILKAIIGKSAHKIIKEVVKTLIRWSRSTPSNPYSFI
jgi:hypothetical protein